MEIRSVVELLRKLDDRAAEVRRMYVLRPARRVGTGRAILTQLENKASQLVSAALSGWKVNSEVVLPLIF
jgi:hypothetical protein